MPNQRRYFLLVFISSIFTCIIAFYIHLHRQGRTYFVDNLIISMTGTLQQGFSGVGRGSKNILDSYLFLVNTHEKNQQLEIELDLLRSKLIHTQELESENSRLRQSLDLRERVPQKLLSARVIAHDVSGDYYSIRIDKGTQHGIEIGMGVISPSGVVGRVFRASSFYSDILTLIDPTSNMDVIVQRSRARGILSGQSKQLSCRLKYIDRLEDVRIQDVLVTSDFSSIFPKGILVGYVTSVIPNPNGILQSISVKSAVDIFRLEEVFVVLSNTRE